MQIWQQNKEDGGIEQDRFISHSTVPSAQKFRL